MKMEADRNRSGAADFVEILLILFVTVSCVFPPLTAFGNNTLLATICLILWMLIAMIRHGDFFRRITPANFCIIAFAVLSVAVPYLFSNSVFGNRYMSLIPMIFFPLIFDYYQQCGRLSIPIRIVAITLCFAAATWFRTTLALLENPWISRSIKSTGEYSLNLARQGIGGYSFIYFLTLAICLLAYLYAISPGFLHRLTVALLILLSMATIALSNYFTALLLAVAGIFLIFTQHMLARRRNLTIIVLWFSVLLIALVWKPVLIAICSVLIQFMGEGKTFSRLQEIIDFLQQGTQLDFLFERFPLLLDSIKTTLDYPLLGISTQPITYSGDVIVGFGQHSHLLDTFALLGIPLGLLYVKVALVPFRVDGKKGVQPKGGRQDGDPLKGGRPAGELLKVGLQAGHSLKGGRLEDVFLPRFSLMLIYMTMLTMNTATSALGFCVGFIYPTIREMQRMKAARYELTGRIQANGRHPAGARTFGLLAGNRRRL